MAQDDDSPKRQRPGQANVFLGAWRFVTGTWVGRISALVAFVPTAWGAWQIIEAQIIPARVTAELECHPNSIVIHANNSGGREATLGAASFEMMSPQRWGDREWHERSLAALEDPIAREPVLGSHVSRRYVYDPGSPLFDSSEMGAHGCRFRVKLPYTSSKGRHEPAPAGCTCEA